ALLWALAAAGCAASRPAALRPGAADCRSLLEGLDRAARAAGCVDAAAARVPGLPFLRVTRFWTAFSPGEMDGASLRFYAGELARLDREGRERELACLGKPELAPRAAACGERLLGAALEAPEAFRRRLAGLRVPDDYRLSMRVLGLYPLVRWPFALAVAHAYAERREWFREDLGALVRDGGWTPARPAAAGPPLPAGEVAAILRRASRNPLGVPLPSPGEARRLAAAFAPVFVQETVHPADRWGAVVPGSGGFRVDGDRPVVYFYLDHLLAGGRPLLRLNYVIWYPERNGGLTPWFEQGAFDGLTFALVLGPDGRPILGEAMNNCGCYHMEFPAPAVAVRARPIPFGPDPLVPQALPVPGPGERLAVFLMSGWHQVLRVTAEASAGPGRRYELRPYAELETPAGPGRRFFDGRGVVPGSERVERFFFFSMGIPAVGSMRQRGHQPITLLGREHYDDPRRLERHFELRLPAGEAGDGAGPSGE
ncbi:hypothetical protein G3N55_10480, partial [Dissulfurirhabdus thermomarina]